MWYFCARGECRASYPPSSPNTPPVDKRVLVRRRCRTLDPSAGRGGEGARVIGETRLSIGTDLLIVYLLLRELQREKVWSRIHLVPLLLAEGDRLGHELEQQSRKQEGDIMKDVKGWEVGKSVYNNPQYYTPNIRFV